VKAVYTGRAVTELEAAHNWYEQQREGLGEAFLEELDAAVARIEANPEMFPHIRSDFRRCLTRRFPFSLIYTVESHRIVIHAVFDNRRNPRSLP
jgi:plasmid stabilization system protein ParE